MKFSLGLILALCLAGLQFAAVTIVVLSSFLSSEKALLEHARGLLSDVGTNTIEHSKGFLAPARGAAELATRLAENEVIASDNFDQLEKLLFQQLQISPQFAGVFYGDQSGNFVYVNRSSDQKRFLTKIVTFPENVRSTKLTWRDNEYRIVESKSDAADTYDPRVRPWYQDAARNLETIWTDPYIFFTSQTPGITVASPVISPDRTLQGVIGVDIEITAISSFLSRLEIGESGVALILNQNGDVIAHPNQLLLKKENDDGSLRFSNIQDIDDPIARVAFEKRMQNDIVSVEREVPAEFDYDGASYVSTIMPVISDALPWTIAIYAPEGDFTAGIRSNRAQNIWIAAGIALISGLIGVAMANYIHKPVRAFAVRSTLISQGELPASAPLPSTYNELERMNDNLVHEIAARKKSEKEVQQLNRDLVHTSRVNMMGQMATTLAHELNQPLSAITQNMDTSLYTLKENADTSQLKTILLETEQQAHRAGDIIRTLREFIRKDQVEDISFDMFELLEQTLHLVEPEAKVHGTSVTIDASHPLSKVRGTRVQVAQVLVNLLRNAIEAIAHSDVKTRHITIEASNTDRGVKICIEDTGPGFDPDFDPFAKFETTKKDGMGLGLSICRTIVEAHGGSLWFDAKSENSRFCFNLPAASA